MADIREDTKIQVANDVDSEEPTLGEEEEAAEEKTTDEETEEDDEKSGEAKTSKKEGKKKKTVAEKKAPTRLSWADRIKQCKEFRKKYGHCKIPTDYKEDRSLGIWVQEVRRNYKMMMEGKKARRPLKPEQITELEEIGFHWGKYKPDPMKRLETDAGWEENFKKLQDYHKEHGNFDVPLEEDGPNKVLGIWVRIQRYQNFLREGKRKCTITKERVKQLKDIGFNWKGDRKIPKTK